MGHKSSKKIVGHPDLEPGEQVIDACFGAGRRLLKAADLASSKHYEQDYEAAAGPNPELDKNGIIALTDRRVAFFPVATAIQKPKALAASWPLNSVTAVIWEPPMLTVHTSAGPVVGVHSSRPERPADFVTAFEAARS